MLSSQGSSCDSKTFDGAESALRCADFRRGVQGGAHLRWVPARWLAPLRAMSQSLVCFFQCLIGAPPQTNGVHNSSVRASLNDTDGPGVQWHCGSQSESTMFAECKGRRRSHGRARTERACPLFHLLLFLIELLMFPTPTRISMVSNDGTLDVCSTQRTLDTQCHGTCRHTVVTHVDSVMLCACQCH